MKEQVAEKIKIGKKYFWIIHDKKLPKNSVRLVSASYPLTRSTIVNINNIREIQNNRGKESIVDKVLNNME